MNKILSKGQLIVLGMMLLLVILSIIIKWCTQEFPIQASVSPLNVELGNSIRFADSTYNSPNVLWQFGDGEESKEKIGVHTYQEIGLHEVKLTVNNENKKFLVNVVLPRSQKARRLVRIKAPSIAIQNQEVVFMAVGESDNWRWEFGDGKKLDSDERNPIHVYSVPGTYEVKLMAANMKYPAVHKITIENEFIQRPPESEVSGEDIKKRLQAIVDGKNSYNENYTYLLKKYLHNNSKIPVLINGVNENEFDMYCRGLRIMGRQQSTIIMDANLEMGANKKVKRIIVVQTNE